MLTKRKIKGTLQGIAKGDKDGWIQMNSFLAKYCLEIGVSKPKAEEYLRILVHGGIFELGLNRFRSLEALEESVS